MRDISAARARGVDTRAATIVAVNEAALDGRYDLGRDGRVADGRLDRTVGPDGHAEIFERAITDLRGQDGQCAR